MAGAILKIGTATIRIANCVPSGVHSTLILRIFSVHYNQIVQLIMPPPPKYFLNFPISRLTAAASTKKLCMDFSAGETVDI